MLERQEIEIEIEIETEVDCFLDNLFGPTFLTPTARGQDVFWPLLPTIFIGNKWPFPLFGLSHGRADLAVVVVSSYGKQ